MISQLFFHPPFEDRFGKNSTHGVDVIIPIIHTNELWEANLKSIYREIPVNRLLISDGGCIDDSLDILKKFPRVEIFDHKKFVSLGYCLRKLIEEVKTERFIYLHSDVYLPVGWFDEMWKVGQQYDWCESKHINTFLVDVKADYSDYDRALSGGQLGLTKSFEKVLPLIDDDYLYRNEDLIFSELIKKFGGKYGRTEAWLYHEIMNKRSSFQRTITRLDIAVEKSEIEEIREFNMQARGLIKYLPPTDRIVRNGAVASVSRLAQLGKIDMKEFKEWIGTTPYADQWLQVFENKKTALNPEIRVFLKQVRDAFRQLVKIIKLIINL